MKAIEIKESLLLDILSNEEKQLLLSAMHGREDEDYHLVIRGNHVGGKYPCLLIYGCREDFDHIGHCKKIADILLPYFPKMEFDPETGSLAQKNKPKHERILPKSPFVVNWCGDKCMSTEFRLDMQEVKKRVSAEGIVAVFNAIHCFHKEVGEFRGV